MKKYELTIKDAFGSCDTDLFKKMAKKGDITSAKVDDVVGHVVKITGYATANVTTEDKNFDIVYYATDEGYFSSGSQVLFNSIEDYMGDSEVEAFKILKIKTSKGHTYKASPIIKESTNEE